MSTRLREIIKNIFITVFIIIIPLIFTKHTPDNQIAIRFISLSFLLFCFSIIYLLKPSLKTIKINRFSSYFFLFLFLYTIISGIGLIYTINFADGIYVFSKIILLVSFITLIILNFNDPVKLIDLISKSFVTLGFVIIIIGVYQLFNLFDSGSVSHENLYKVTVTFGHKNIFAQVLLLCLPFSIYLIYKKRIWWKYLGIFNALFSIIILTVLMTRSVWIAGVLSFITTSIIGLFTYKLKYLNLKRMGLFSIPFLLLILSTIVLYSKFDKSSAFEKQISKIVNFKYGSTKDRIMLWEKSFKLAKEKPVFGHGVGSWKVNILKYGNQNLKSEDNLTFYQRPHNDFIWIFCEQGIIALISYLLVFITCILIAIKLLKSNVTNNVKWFTLLMIFALLSYLIFSFFSFPMDRIEFSVFLSLIFGSIILLSNKYLTNKTQIISIKTIYITIGTSFLLLLTTILGLIRLDSEIHINNAYEARANNKWNLMLSEIKKSENKFYKIDPFSTPLSWYSGIANFNLGKYRKACHDFKSAYKTNPYHIHVINNLATCDGIRGNYNTALDLYKKALKIAPNFEDATYNICGIYQKLNDVDSAIYYIKQIKKPINKNRYNKIILILTKQKLNALVINQEKNVTIYIQSVLKDNNAILDLFYDSIKNGCTIEKQILTNIHGKYDLEK